MQLADHYTSLIAHQLVTSAAQGIHTIPQALADDHAELLQLIEDGHVTVNGGAQRWASPAAEQKAEKHAVRLHRLGNYGGRTGIIRDHIAPALDAYLDKFQAARRTAGRHAQQADVNAQMLLEPQDVREAIAFLHHATLHYGQIRSIWALLRGGGDTFQSASTVDVDPRGANSPLGECFNINELIPDWWNAGNPGHAPWPWGNVSAAHVRLTWLLDHGAQLWAPTAAEHDARYRELRDNDLASRRTASPSRTVPNLIHAAA